MKIKLLVTIFMIFFIFSENVFGISEHFKYVIDTIGIPEYNVYGQSLNEEVYYTYNVFCYGSPKESSLNCSEKFKSVANGKWTDSDTSYKGAGTPGEYYYLGREYNGSLVRNVYYPVSFFPDTVPNDWNYQIIEDASSSWKDSSKYKYVEQLEYMKNAPILYDELDFVNRVTNPYNLVNYGISANEIGLNKVRLNTCSTWKTKGILDVVRKDKNGKIRYSIFATEPMAASATVKSNLNARDSYTIEEDETVKSIVINFGASVENITDYAKVSHIKEIKSNLYINGELVSTIKGEKTKDILKSYSIILKREDANLYPLYIEVKSTLYTEFAVDGLMEDGLSKAINVNIKEHIPKIESADIKLLNKKDNKYFVSNLLRTSTSNNCNCAGIVQAGNHLALKVETHGKDSQFIIYINDSIVQADTIYKSGNTTYLDIQVPNEYITISGWNTAREKINNYFNINLEDIGTRCNVPNKLKIKYGKSEEIFIFDVIDNYNFNMNYTFKNVLNKEEIEEKLEISKW